uniref:Cytochrome c oxidase subunit 3 n=1 Tax=Microthoracius praelongiceps TaxID=1958934 RepID=A0A1S5XVR7_9NEOP|nr:cytochrome c oxidase subunit 3 [Microthoracius praelongiceps]
MKFHPFHIVSPSPWPFMLSVNLTVTIVSVFFMFNGMKSFILQTSILSTLIVFMFWMIDIARESGEMGDHTKEVQKGLKFGFTLFIVSEVMFFASFFSAMFYLSLSPDISVGGMYPPMGISSLDYSLIPLLNSIILLSSGISITWSHHSLMENNKPQTILGLFITMILGAMFLTIQIVEYYNSSFSISDSVFGSVFFVSTGFHGIHVMVGLIFISTSIYLIYKNKMTSVNHQLFEMSAWYWHFVDVVWMFLFIILYWWGG